MMFGHFEIFSLYIYIYKNLIYNILYNKYIVIFNKLRKVRVIYLATQLKGYVAKRSSGQLFDEFIDY